jgi:hypothetical protein
MMLKRFMKQLMKSIRLRFLLGGMALVLACGLTPIASAQTRTIRVVCYNIEDDITNTTFKIDATTPLPGLIFPYSGGSTTSGGVLEGIGEEILADGVAQPIDILALEETSSNPQTVAPIVAGLNAFYSVTNPLASSMYAMSPYQATNSGGTNDGNGPNALVFNTFTVQLLASVPVDPPGGYINLGATYGEYREVMRYEFAPAGVTPAASNEFYVYVSHYKSGTTSADMTDRAGEAQIIRNDEAANLPASARVLYVGDYNVDTSGEAGYQTILAAKSPGGVAQGQGIDPLNVSGSSTIDWEDTTTNKAILVMLTEEAYELRYRDDLQIMTSNVYYGVPGGLCLVANTYHAFGNNGSLTYGAPVTAGTNTALAGNLAQGALINAATLYLDLTNASDHLPVVADYTIPVSVPPVQLGNGVLSTTSGFQFVLSNADGSAVTSGEQSRIGFYATTNLALAPSNWTALTNSILLTNGVLNVNDSNGLIYPQRFYRAVEKP